MRKQIELKPIIESQKNYDIIERRMIAAFKNLIYAPMLRILGRKSRILKNNYDPLGEAIQSGRVVYSRGTFYGKFTAEISQRLREIGAQWSKKNVGYEIQLEELPMEYHIAIKTAIVRQEETLKTLDRFLGKVDTEFLAKSVQTKDIFDQNLWQVEKEFDKSVRKITVAPVLSTEQRERISVEWAQDLEKDVKKFSDENVRELRQLVDKNLFGLGNRKEELEDKIEAMLKSIGEKNWPNVQNKAKFLARQETNLAMAKYKQTRYESAGVKKYRWKTVHMPYQPSPNAPYLKGEVRYKHGLLENKIFEWSNPPITTPPGQKERRNNPGEDFNCRCYAIPIVEFDEENPSELLSKIE